MTKPTYDLSATFEWEPGTSVPVPFGIGNCIEGRGWTLEKLEGTFTFTAEEESVSEMLFSLRKWPFIAVTDDGTEVIVTITDFMVVRILGLADGGDPLLARCWVCTPVDWEIK